MRTDQTRKSLVCRQGMNVSRSGSINILKDTITNLGRHVRSRGTFSCFSFVNSESE